MKSTRAAQTDQPRGLLEGKLPARRLLERPLLAQQVARGADAAEIVPEADDRARRGEGEHESDQAGGHGVEGADAEGDGVLRPGDAVEAQPGGQQHEQQRRGRRVQRKIDRGVDRDRRAGGQQRRDRPPRGARQRAQARDGRPSASRATTPSATRRPGTPSSAPACRYSEWAFSATREYFAQWVSMGKA